MENESIGKYIRKLRKEKGYTIVELSELSGVSNPYISQIENDKFVPSPEILERLALALKVSYIDLMHRAGYIKKPRMYDELNDNLVYLAFKRSNVLIELRELNKELKEAEDKNDIEKIKDLLNKISELEKIEMGLKEELDNLHNTRAIMNVSIMKDVESYGRLDDKEKKKIGKKISLNEILLSDIPIEINGKFLTTDDKKKLLKIAETMFSE